MTLIPFLIGYYVALTLLGVLNFFVIVHVFKYKYLGARYKYILIIYFFILAFVVGATQLFVLKVNWSEVMVFPSIFNPLSLTGELLDMMPDY